MRQVAVIGGGAAGCFCAVGIRRAHPDTQVTVFESASKPMAKLAITGGGRCNITNSFALIDRLEDAYPRGHQLLKRVFNIFGPEDTVRWWEGEGVRLVVQDDQCIFPESQDAMQVVRTLERLMRNYGVEVKCNCRVDSISSDLEISYTDRNSGNHTFQPDAIVVTAGGCSKEKLGAMLPEGTAITDTLPSLFTFKINDPTLTSLMGTVVDEVTLRIAGSAFRSEGTLLVTDWGLSGPAALKLSSYAARHLAKQSYKADILINWTMLSEDEAREWLKNTATQEGRKLVSSIRPEAFTERLWKHILQRAGIRADMRWAELGSSGMQKLANRMIADQYAISGRCSFKEEFVTCGGVDLSGVNIKTLESKSVKGLFFAGEVLDIDAITGGFNLQAAWSTAYVAAQEILR